MSALSTHTDTGFVQPQRDWSCGSAGSLEFQANELRWLHTMTPALERALSGRGVASR
ncbi:hypothetical protein ACFQY7_11220 [Actinomadura luteofluorescens]|uniref:hypothetical protein n=1 Tax=Actinomadura luteofluorescens TaxID=46163 RepID=UPI0036400FCB